MKPYLREAGENSSAFMRGILAPRTPQDEADFGPRQAICFVALVSATLALVRLILASMN